MEDSLSINVLNSFAYHLIENNLLSEKIALESLQQSNKEKIPYISFLNRKKLLTEYQIASATSEYFGLPLFDLNALNEDLIPSEFLNLSFVKKRIALPLYVKNGYLYLSVADPTIESIYESRFLTGLEVRLIITLESYLSNAIDRIINKNILSEIHHDEPNYKDMQENLSDNFTDLEIYNEDSAPVINYVNKILLDAINKSASDIHFERYEDIFRIRYRLNGELVSLDSPPIKLANFILARIKIMANLDITEHRIPQDGRMSLTVNKHKSVDFRVSICPMVYGEKIVLRILDSTKLFLNLNDLGMEEIEKNRLIDALNHSQGLILVTGPTGSGKTVTLYSSLSYLNSEDKNIVTVEDPVEISLNGINQVHVNSKVGLSFSVALRSFLRQDPDIIMVGEIRDVETAEIAIRAAQTGHLVLSTLHTNSAPETINRLMNMGIASYNLASSLILVIAQRLVRTLCHSCKQKEDLPKEILLAEGFVENELNNLEIYKAVGCGLCFNGYTGRIGIFEVLPVTTEMNNLIMNGGSSLEIREQAQKEGIKNLREKGLDKVRAGITSILELNQVFK